MKIWNPRLTLPGIGAGIGLAVAALSFQLCGGGHGWTATFVSMSAVLLAPGAGVALALRGSRAGMRLAVVLVVLALAADLEIVRRTIGEGLSFTTAAWQRTPVLVTLWAWLWMSWQLALIPLMLGRSEALAVREAAVS